ncbi:AGL287Wp [Eremothecium gossypii ATCC 10895]|uniref:Serine/threonine-protein kinase TEL1 n=1 Tax=Eremothecium gossypii (strain ATCC 10895 / CBS 109.51 / FGSC 9923 / NRRL Y-1056) TaxID=284811 RepID=ATM_EREGS|nr:AGL287Wp [Eremothecium gossypii ATCC 10895]Q751J3.1 RecName: Full=Serine/threonine-protein kinase TEL1; AltName: Full=ATM homolog; AltName: Full=DNA-damage checkpoint kinase TEL1; AltName: Full=Telomere length regulation protein 1 [Eremothecium gossypii ATCC 10895]AAS54204.1 AGL287Wp [Eremothecium gossypii ATCC 10895]AEY98530.1 FAGL287Wp [Eremothecium gossypii FDAG1]
MEQYVASAINLLSSPKLKERSQALTDVAAIVKDNPDTLTSKSVGALVQSLIDILDAETRKFDELCRRRPEAGARVELAQGRLNSVVAVLRLVLETIPDRLRAKQFRGLVLSLPELLGWAIREQVHDMLQPLSACLQALTECHTFKLKVDDGQWRTLVRASAEDLVALFGINCTHKSIAKLAGALTSLIRMDAVGFKDVCEELLLIPVRYYQNTDKETANMRSILQLCNLLVLKGHLIKFHGVQYLIHCTMQHLLQFTLPGTDYILEEIAVFTLFSAELMIHEVPYIPGDLESGRYFGKEVLSELYQQFIVHLLENYRPQKLQLKDLEYRLLLDRRQWYQLDDFQISPHASHIEWLQLQGISNMLCSYYAFQHRHPVMDISQVKRRRLSDTYNSFLLNSQYGISFATSCIDSNPVSSQLLGLQLAACVTSFHECPKYQLEELLDAILRRFENANLVGWCCLAMLPLCSQLDLVISETVLQKLLKLTLPLLKIPTLSAVASALISKLLDYQQRTLTGSNMLQQCYDLYELSDIIGPAVVSNESFRLWQSLHIYGGDFRGKDGSSAADRIANWLFAKLNTVSPLDESQNSFPHFLGWLAGCQLKDAYEVNRAIHVNSYCLEWEYTSVERTFLLSIETSRRLSRNRTTPLQNMNYESSSISELFYRILDKITSQDDIEAYGWMCFGLQLIHHIRELTYLVEYVNDLKKAICLRLGKMNFGNSQILLSCIRQTTSLPSCDILPLFFTEREIANIIYTYKELKLTEVPEGPAEDDFAGPAKARHKLYPLNHLYAGKQGFEIDYVVSFIIMCSDYETNGDAAEKVIELFLQLARSLPTNLIFQALPTLITYIGSNDRENISEDTLLALTEFTGSSLLTNEYNTSTLSITYLSLFLKSISRYWLSDTHMPSLTADCNDILEWIFSRLGDSSCIGCEAIMAILDMTLHMLKNYNRSNSKFTFDKQHLFHVLTTCLGRLPKFYICKVVHELNSYVVRLGLKNQSIIFSEFAGLFDPPQRDAETAAYYSLTLAGLGTISHMHLSNAILHVLPNLQHKHVSQYALSFLKSVAGFHKLSGIRALFHLCRFEILDIWSNKCAGLRDFSPIWNTAIFQFESFEQFINEYKHEVAAYYFAKLSPYHYLKSTLVNDDKELPQLLEISLQYAIPLAYIPGGIGDAIFDICADQWSATNHTNVLKQQYLLIFDRLLHFADLTVFMEYFESLQKVYTNSELIHKMKKYTYNLHPKHLLSYSLRTALKVIHSKVLLGKLSIQELRFLLTLNLQYLQESTLPDDRSQILRKIQIILVAYEQQLEDASSVSDLLEILTDYLDDPLLGNEVGALIGSIVALGFNVKYTESLFLCIFAKLLPQLHEAKTANLSILLNDISNTLTINNSNIIHGKWWHACIDALAGTSLFENTIYHDDSLLDTELLDHRALNLYSEILSFLPPFTGFPPNFVPKERVLRHLISQTTTFKLHDNFLLWKGHYIGMYHKFHGTIPQLAPNGPNQKLSIDKLVKNYGLLNGIFELLEAIEKTTHARIKFICQCINAVSLSHKDSLSTFTADTQQFFGQLSSKSVPLDLALFFYMFPISNPSESMETFCRLHYPALTSDYSSWLVKLTMFALDMLGRYIPVVKCFEVLATAITSRVEQLLNYWLLLLLYCDPNNGIRLLCTLISNIGLLKSTKEGILKIKYMLNLLLIVRSFHKLGYKEFDTIYDRISLQDAYKVAAEVGEKYIACLLFEEFHMPNLARLDVTYMKEIYKQFDDVDMIYGIPTTASLASAIELINQTQATSLKSFMMNNGNFDAQYATHFTGNIGNLVNSASNNGFTGLAYALQNISSSKNTSATYNWCIELDKWDLPTPDILDSTAKSIYSIIKKTDINTGTAEAAFKSTMLNALQFLEKTGVNEDNVSQLGSIVTMVQLYNNNAEKLVKSLHAQDRKILKVKDFNDYYMDIKVRHVFLDHLIDSHKNRLSEEQSICLRFASICELSHLSEVARGASDFQRSLDAVLLLEKSVLALPTNSSVEHYGLFKTFARRMSTIQSAKMLWSQNETVMSIDMLKDLLHTPLSSNLIARARKQPFFQQMAILDINVKAQLVQWLSHSRQDVPERIFKNYIGTSLQDIENYGDNPSRTEIVHTFGKFCYDQAKRFSETNEVDIMARRVSKNKEELAALYQLYHDRSLPERERKEAKRHYARLLVRNQQETETYNQLRDQRELFVTNALLFFTQTLQYDDLYDGEVIDQFCGLWFEYSNDDNVSGKLLSNLQNIPEYKLLPWINQMASKLADDESPFQKTLRAAMVRILLKLPYDSLYVLIGMSLTGSRQNAKDSGSQSRLVAVESLLKEVSKHDYGSYATKYLLPVREFCEMSVSLASQKFAQNTRKIHLNNLKIGTYWLKELKGRKLPLPTAQSRVSDRCGNSVSRSYITQVDPDVRIASSGLSLPKIVTFTLSDGTRHRALLKAGNDDLRQDAIMEQVFKQVNKILTSNKRTRKLKLRIRTYEVIPLGPQAGIIEFAPNSKSLHEILAGYHKDDTISLEQARKAMKAVQGKSKEQRIAVYVKITESVKPVLRNFFYETFLDPEEWLLAKATYTKGVVTNSIVGHILGLGDRHLNNILLDKFTGEPIHIDLGVAFDQGKLLPLPELVPFRLTRDIVDGFGVMGVEGLFRKNCEKVYGLLRKERERVMCVLNVLKWDPLYSWKMTPLRRQKLQGKLVDGDSPSDSLVTSLPDSSDNDESRRALKGVEDKLLGNGLSVEATVQELVHRATDVSNLAVIFMGWSPFY